MNDTSVFEPKFWNGAHKLSALQETLFSKLVPGYGAAATPHGELLRCVTRIYYDLYNNGLCNGPFEEEVATIQKHERDVMARMDKPEKLGSLLRAVAPAGAKWGDTQVKNSSTWRHAPALEDLMAAAVLYAEAQEHNAAADDEGLSVALL